MGKKQNKHKVKAPGLNPAHDDEEPRVLELPDDYDENADKQTKVEENTKPNSLIEDEDRETGEVNKEVYLDYQRFSGSYVWIVLAIVSMVL